MIFAGKQLERGSSSRSPTDYLYSPERPTRPVISGCGLSGFFKNMIWGLIAIVQKEIVPGPLKKVHLSAAVVDCVAEVTIIQDYVNENLNPIEVLCCYPVDESAAINSFEAVIDGNEVVAMVKEK